MWIVWLIHYVNTIVTALSLCVKLSSVKCDLNLPFYLEILSLELSFPESRASLVRDIIPCNTGGTMRETTEIYVGTTAALYHCILSIRCHPRTVAAISDRGIMVTYHMTNSCECMGVNGDIKSSILITSHTRIRIVYYKSRVLQVTCTTSEHAMKLNACMIKSLSP